MKHIMVDLETLDTRPTAVILSVGAVEFTAAGITSQFYAIADRADCGRRGLTTSAETLAWWGKQGPEARAVLESSNSWPLDLVLEAFNEFAAGAMVWGNGATFDNVILRNAFGAVGVEPSWEFWNDSCYRTVSRHWPKRVQLGQHHHALDDARSQAEHMIQHGAGWLK